MGRIFADNPGMAWTLITGGATRLGREIALAFAQAGWGVACHYRDSREAALDLCDSIRQQGGSALAIRGELENEASCHALWEELTATTGTQLRCVVNNASLFEPDEARTMDEAAALQQLQVNLMAPLRLSRWLAQLQEAGSAAGGAPGGGASVVHVLDQKVFNLNPDYFSYTLSKLALERAVSLQAQSLAPTLRVNAVAPGLMYLSGPQSPENFERASRANLMRHPLNPRHVADSVVFLATNPGITGTTLRVDNGQHLVPSPRDIMFVTDTLLNPAS
jgi:NAD(P)-dependent dehydrogenase (short-subunit alcohol dehydrogenase family)